MENFNDAKEFDASTLTAEPEQDAVIAPSAIESITRAEIDMQVATAHRFPRSVKRFREEALSMATIDEDTAESCFYKLPRDGKMIEGPSIRLMEIAASAWGNIRYGSRTTGEDAEFITAQGIAHDLERNVSATVEVRRRITNKAGKRYSGDMVNVTANAAGSIARRNALLGVIPRAYINSIYEQAKQVAIGDAQTLSHKRTNAVQYFAKLGITPDRLYSKLGVTGEDDITLAHIETLIGLKTAIKDGEIGIDEAFPETAAPKVTGSPDAMKPGKKDKADKPADGTLGLED
jgi:hypothetical protein